MPVLPDARRLDDGLTLEDCYRAVSGEGPLAAQWTDKPHRLVYDLVAYGRLLEERLQRVRDLLDQAGPNPHGDPLYHDQYIHYAHRILHGTAGGKDGDL